MPLGANKAAIMGVAGVSTGDVVLLQSQTADDDSIVVFTSGITSTYGEYIFRFYNMNPATDGTNFTFQTSTDGGSNYGMTTTATMFRAKHEEDASAASLDYQTGADQAQTTGYMRMSLTVGNGADESLAGELHLFNPSSTTYAKHFYSKTNYYNESDQSQEGFTSGYINSTDDVDAIRFEFTSGTLDGTIKMWGVKN